MTNFGIPNAINFRQLLLTMAIVLGLAGHSIAQNTTSISVSGNQRIATSTIVEISGLATGQSYSQAQYNAAKQALVNSGFFETVELVVDGNAVRIVVVELPVVNRIAFEGNRKLKDEDLQGIVLSQSRQTLSVAQVEADARAIAEAYSAGGRLGATVTPRLIERSDSRVDVVFEVVEGRVSDIERIAFTGNRSFSDSRLRSAIDSKQAGILRGLVSRDTFLSERVAGDQQRLIDFYRNRGFVDMRVTGVNQELTRDGSAVLLTFNIEEGPRYAFGETRVETEVERIDVSRYQDIPRLKQGRVTDPRKVQNTTLELDAALAKDGFPMIVSRVETQRNDETRQIDFIFKLVETDTVIVERIDIIGNATTLDRVIRREFDIVEGDVLNLREIRLANERLRALGFFEQIDISTQQGSTPNSVVIKVAVVEGATGSLSFGGAYDTTSGVTLSLGLSERNFLGRGQYFAFDLSNAEAAKNYRISFTEPRFLDRDVSVGFDLGLTSSSDTSFGFSDETFEFNPRVAFNLTENSRLRLGWDTEFQNLVLNDLDDDNLADVDDISDIIERDAGERWKHALQLRYTLDRRNSVIAPTGGYSITADQEFALVPSGGSFSKTSLKFRGYTALANDTITLRADVETGALFAVDGYARVTDRFFLGGSSMQGFKPRGIGPREQAGAGGGTGQAVGGNYYALARGEARFPIGLPESYGITGGLFVEAGSVWGLNDIPAGSDIDDSFFLNSAVGVSLFWDAGFAPLRFNWSTPLSSRSYDEPESFRFSIDAQF